MQSKIVFGNAQKEGTKRWGWFIGHFITPDNDPRSTSDLEVKWGVHQAGDGRREWATNAEATTLSILISGRFRVQFPDEEIVLSDRGVSRCTSYLGSRIRFNYFNSEMAFKIGG